MFTPNPWEEDAYDENDPKGEHYVENLRAFSDEARARIRRELGAMTAHLTQEGNE